MKRVLIYSTRSLFGQGIKNLLDAETEFEVIGWESDVEEAVKRIQEMQPDAVLVVNQGTSDAHMSEGQRFLRAGGEVKIIELNLENRKGSVYFGRSLAIQEIGDLVRAIEEPVTVVRKKPHRSGQIREPKEKREY